MHQILPCSCHRTGCTPSHLFAPAIAAEKEGSCHRHPEGAQSHTSRAEACIAPLAHTPCDSRHLDNTAAIHTSPALRCPAPLAQIDMNLADTPPFQHQNTSIAQRGNVRQQHRSSRDKRLSTHLQPSTLGSAT